MLIKIVDKKITESELQEIAKEFCADMIKGVMDVGKIGSGVRSL